MASASDEKNDTNEEKQTIENDNENGFIKNEEKQTSYRISSKSLFLTYPQCPLSLHDFLQLFSTLTNFGSNKLYYISTEKHTSTEGDHLHVYIEYHEKQEMRDATSFYTLIHNNKKYVPHFEKIKKGEGNKNRIILYVCKYDNFITNYKPSSITSNNYSKNIADHAAWQRDRELVIRQPNIYPIKYFEQTIEKPDPSNKKRHLWIIGAPDIGKTYNLNKSLFSFTYYLRKPDRYPFESYNQEEIVVYDDIYPITFQELTCITQTFTNSQTTVPGGSRYRPNYIHKDITRTIMVVSNDFPNYFTSDTNKIDNSKAFAARFKVIMLSHKKDSSNNFNLDILEIPTHHLIDEQKFQTYIDIHKKRSELYEQHKSTISQLTNESSQYDDLLNELNAK